LELGVGLGAALLHGEEPAEQIGYPGSSVLPGAAGLRLHGVPGGRFHVSFRHLVAVSLASGPLRFSLLTQTSELLPHVVRRSFNFNIVSKIPFISIMFIVI
jgi:hypothetical protein